MEPVRVTTYRNKGVEEDWAVIQCAGAQFARLPWMLSASPNQTIVQLRLTPDLKAQIRTLVEGWDTDEMAEMILVDRDGQ